MIKCMYFILYFYHYLYLKIKNVQLFILVLIILIIFNKYNTLSKKIFKYFYLILMKSTYNIL